MPSPASHGAPRECPVRAPSCRPRTSLRRGAPVAPFRLPALVALLALLGLLACGPTGGSRDADAAPGGSGEDDVAAEGRQRLPPRGEAWVVFGGDTVRAEVAATQDAREEGLMYRRELPEGRGMLFVFDDEAIRSFWMKNTYVPLSVAFLNSSMRIVDIQRMEPETDDYHDSDGPAMYALEVPQGWFEEHGIGEGESAEIVFGPR